MMSPTLSIPPQAPHVPVLIEEVVKGLAVVPGETLVDGTFGAGGYTQALLGAGAGRVIGFDRDQIEGEKSVEDLRVLHGGKRRDIRQLE